MKTRIPYIVLSLLLLIVHPVTMRASATATENPAADSSDRIAVIGSSVAAGWVTSHSSRYDMENGYAARLGRLLEQRGYEVVNISVPGNATGDVLGRLEADLVPLDARFTIIGLSLSNEGIECDNPDSVFAAFQSGMKQIIGTCRKHGVIPIVGSCYSNNNYTAEQYRYIREMNLLMNTWDVPAINLLGAVDDGNGHFPGPTFDPGHPGNSGHEEMFLSIVPSLFDALTAGKPMPCRPETDGSVKIINSDGQLPLSWVPDDVVHSFTLAFSIRTNDAGTIAGINTGASAATISIDDQKRMEYHAVDGTAICSEQRVADNTWHDVLVAHCYWQNETRVYLDGRRIGSVTEQLEPRLLVVGGCGSIIDHQKYAESPPEAHYRDLLIYRSALNDDEVDALVEGEILQASLEVYAPLQERLSPNQPVDNRAQSLSEVIATSRSGAGRMQQLAQKITLAQQAREAELHFPQPVVIDLSQTVLARYSGMYEIAPGDMMEISVGEGVLILHDRGQQLTLEPESMTRFFFRHPMDIFATFELDDQQRVAGLLLEVAGQQIAARRVDE